MGESSPDLTDHFPPTQAGGIPAVSAADPPERSYGHGGPQRGSSAALLFIYGRSRGFPAFILARRQNQTPLPKPAGEQ